MRDHDVGSVLVVRASQPHDLLGIFTERDLIHRVDEIEHGGYWEKAVSTVMTQPVITLSVNELARAAEVMMKKGIRHLPVVYEDENRMQHIAGVISMRDLFVEWYTNLAPVSRIPDAVDSGRKVVVASRDELSRKVLKTIFEQNGHADVVELAVSTGMIPEALKLHPAVLVLDLDFVAPAHWAKLLQQISHEQKGPRTLVLFTPGFHDPKNVAVLTKLGKLGSETRITAFAKPINVLEVLQKAQLAT
jgi:CBS-domain-containing membrane protein